MLFRVIKRASRMVVLSSAAILALSLTMPSVQAGGHRQGCVQPCPAPCPAPAPAVQPAQPQPAQPQPAVEPALQPEQFAAGGGGETFAGAAPHVIGDSLSGIQTANQRILGLKITEIESPRPQDRIYIGYNHFSDVNYSGISINRTIFGVEYMPMGSDSNVSIGVRLPYFSSDDATVNALGNMNLIGKYALINNVENGNILSTGLAVTVPTGTGVPLPAGGPGGATPSELNTVFFQPFVGWIVNGNNTYVQGFSAIAVPTDARDITVLFNDFAVGYWLYRTDASQFITGVVPTLEAHINTPLSHQGYDRNSAAYGLQDSVVLTAGTHLVINQASILTLGAAAPITGPKPFDVEAMAQFNLRF